MNILKKLAVAVSLSAVAFAASAQKYSNGLIDKTVAIVGNEMIKLSDVEEEMQMMMKRKLRMKSGKEKWKYSKKIQTWKILQNQLKLKLY